jgi:hypothetical protein
MLRAAVLFTSSLAVAGCVADSGGEGFVILNNTAVTGTTCMLTGGMGQPFVSHGQISTSSPSGYLLTPLMQSQVTAMTGQETQRTIQFQGANIELTVEALTIGHSDGTFTRVDPPPALMGTDGKFQSLFSGSLLPGGTANVAFEVIPKPTIAAIVQAAGAASGDSMQAEVKAIVKPYGTMGGSRVDGAPFSYPVTVCNDCVVVDHGACPFVGTLRTGDPCQPFQDGPVDCCHDANNALVCPALMQ